MAFFTFFNFAFFFAIFFVLFLVIFLKVFLNIFQTYFAHFYIFMIRRRIFFSLILGQISNILLISNHFSLPGSVSALISTGHSGYKRHNLYTHRFNYKHIFPSKTINRTNFNTVDNFTLNTLSFQLCHYRFSFLFFLISPIVLLSIKQSRKSTH